MGAAADAASYGWSYTAPCIISHICFYFLVALSFLSCSASHAILIA